MALQIPGYRIIRKINQGGMATVYLAIQLSVGRQVALKVMSPALNADPVFSQRFQREAKIVGQLSHPNIISIYDIGRFKGLNYIAMDYLAGGTLQDKMRSGISVNEALTIIESMALALDHAHSKGYVHRDIKPENILFREDGSAVLTDFGVARALSSASVMTSAGKIIGTPHYMSPEQARGKPLDGRSDLYSLGVVLYEVLTGSVPFQAEEAVAIAVKHITLPVPRLPAQHARLQPLLDKMLAKDAEDRFQRGLEVSQAIVILRSHEQSIFQPNPTEFQPTTIQIVVLLRVLLTASIINGWNKLKQLTNWRFSLGHGLYRCSPAESITVTSAQVDTAEDDRPTLISSARAVLGPNDQNTPIRSKHWLLLPLLGLLMWLAICLAVNSLPGVWLQHLPAGLSSAAQTQNHYFSRLFVTPAATSDKYQSRSQLPAEQEPNELQPPDLITDSSAPKSSVSAEPERHSLTVAATPPTARIRILNIVEKYRHGIELTPGSYHLEVTESGFKPHFEWITIKYDDVTHRVTLMKKPEPGSIFQDSINHTQRGPTMVVVPEGSFFYESDKAAKGKVTFLKPFAVSQYEITFADFGKFAEATNRPMPADNHWGKGSRPVINISWNDASAYVLWLSSETGEPYRLPNNKEWEYVARGGTESDYYWQEQADKSSNKSTYANCRRGCDSPFSNLFRTKTAPVGSFAANPFHLFDTAGNVAEWVEDCYQQPADSADASSGCLERTVRGGSIKNSIRALKVQHRDKRRADKGFVDVGFRVVRDLY